MQWLVVKKVFGLITSTPLMQIAVHKLDLKRTPTKNVLLVKSPKGFASIVKQI
jgi:hypothetical protein